MWLPPKTLPQTFCKYASIDMSIFLQAELETFGCGAMQDIFQGGFDRVVQCPCGYQSQAGFATADVFTHWSLALGKGSARHLDLQVLFFLTYSVVVTWCMIQGSELSIKSLQDSQFHFICTEFAVISCPMQFCLSLLL